MVFVPVVLLLLFPFAAANNSQCEKHFKRYFSDLEQKKTWAVSMFDATAKLQAGILSKNYASLGFFDQCLEISENTTDGLINGKYCLGNVEITENSGSMQLTWGVCIPDSCQGEDIGQVIYLDIFSSLIDTERLSLKFDSNLCQTKEQAHPTLSIAAIFTILIFGTIALVVLTSTLIDYFKCSIKSRTAVYIIKSFSAIINGKKVFCYSQNGGQLLCLNGLKAISLLWIILLHEYTIAPAGPLENGRDFELWNDSLLGTFQKSGSLAVETFFVIGGLLLSYNYLNKVENGIPFNLFNFFIHRILRILPTLAAVVLVSATLLPYFGSGPYWPYFMQYFQKPCETHWWSTLLFVQNYVNVDLMCTGHSWYLSVDMQLFLLSPLILLPLKVYKKTTVTCIMLLILLSVISTFFLSWSNGLIAMSDSIFGNLQLLNTTYYLKTHTRASSWLIGFLLGILIHDLKDKPLKLHKIVVVCLWTLTISIFLFCTIGGHYTLRTMDYKRFDNAFYLALNRPAFALAICWIITSCIFGYGGLINRILLLPPLQVISKLVYSTYLIHVSMMYAFVYSSKTPNHFSNITILHKFWGDCIFSMFLAMFSVLVVEYPSARLDALAYYTPLR